MPLTSREVVTLRLILDCDAEEEAENWNDEGPGHPPPLLRLPIEIRLKILRFLLRIDRNRKAHTRRPPPSCISELLYLNPRRILEAAPFKHKGGQEIDGNPPVLNTCHISTAVMATCKQLYWEGKTVLYNENKVLGLQSGIRGLGAKLRNYGIPVFGPLPASRLITSSSPDSQTFLSKIDPVVLFSGQNIKGNTPFYFCSYKDSVDFIHALWIMIKCPFARGMRYNLTLSAQPRYRFVNRTDIFIKFAVLPWLHNHIASINFHGAPSTTLVGDNGRAKSIPHNYRLEPLRNELTRQVNASNKEPNLHTYKAICLYLEQVLLQGEICIDHAKYLSAELIFERVCYEASSIVRTRTNKLVDVSAKSKDGINRVCKLIAVSAYRLCELRSGSLARLLSKRTASVDAVHTVNKVSRDITSGETGQLNNNASDGNDTLSECSTAVSDSDTPANLSKESNDDSHTNLAESGTADLQPVTARMASGSRSSPSASPSSASLSAPRTTRLSGQLARDLAITGGLLALRLPCASPVPEWNIRLDIMLLRLFADRNDTINAVWCLRRIHSNCNIELQELKLKKQGAEKGCEALNGLMTTLAKELRPGAPKSCFCQTADMCQEVVTALWGDRLIPKKGFNGLIWTFRWAG